MGDEKSRFESELEEPSIALYDRYRYRPSYSQLPRNTATHQLRNIYCSKHSSPSDFREARSTQQTNSLEKPPQTTGRRR